MEDVVNDIDHDLAAGESPDIVPEPDEPRRLIDGGGTAHWFAVTENEHGHDLRYFRSFEDAGGVEHADSYPVLPVTDDDSAWPLPGLEMYLEKGDLHTAQQFAHDVSDAYGGDFPDPLDLPALNPAPEYYIGYGVGPNDQPALDTARTWMG